MTGADRALRPQASGLRLQAVGAVAACVVGLGCGDKKRDEAVARLSSPNAKQRAEAVRALGRSSDDESWAALLRAVRDGSPAVRVETAAALAAVKREEAPDAIAPLLRDPDDSVRVAAVHALGGRCGEKTAAYLRLAFTRSGAAVRGEIAGALQGCGVDPAQTLLREENERRLKAQGELRNPSAAVRAQGARELGLLGRAEDRARLATLLDERDGVVVAAAVRALGESGAQDAAARIRALLGEGGEVAAAAAEALLALGPAAVGPARQELLALAAGAGDEALPAAVAASAGQRADAALCAAALAAQEARAAAVLAAGCPAAPLAQALGGAKKRDPLLEALLRSEPPAPALDAVLTRLLRQGDSDPRLPRLALRFSAAGPALLNVLRHEQAARARELQQARRRSSDDDGSAAEIARTPAPGAPDRERYTRLMGLLNERAGAESGKASAAARLEALLHGAAESDPREFVAQSLRALRALRVPGGASVLAAFASDPDPVVSSAARGDPPATPPAPPAAAPASSLWSDDGAVRARACAGADPALAATRTLLAAADPERRVRDACALTNETAHRK